MRSTKVQGHWLQVYMSVDVTNAATEIVNCSAPQVTWQSMSVTSDKILLLASAPSKSRIGHLGGVGEGKQVLHGDLAAEQQLLGQQPLAQRHDLVPGDAQAPPQDGPLGALQLDAEAPQPEHAPHLWQSHKRRYVTHKGQMQLWSRRSRA